MNNLLFELIDEKIDGYKKAIRNAKSHNNQMIDEWKRKINYYECCKEIIANSIDLFLES